MALRFMVNESSVESAWLKTLYDLIEELNCKCKTYLDEKYNKHYKTLERIRVIEI